MHLSQKRYLSATNLLIEGVNLSEGNLMKVEGLRELTAELYQKKDVILDSSLWHYFNVFDEILAIAFANFARTEATTIHKVFSTCTVFTKARIG